MKTHITMKDLEPSNRGTLSHEASRPAGSVEGESNQGTDRDAGMRVPITDGAYRLLFEESPHGVLVTSLNGRILGANRAACRSLGRSELELRRLERYDLIRVGDPRFPALVAEYERTGQCQGELALVRGDGSSFDAEVASVTVADAHGPLTFVTFSDITSQKLAEARARSQARWLDRVNEAIFVTDAEHRVVYWSQGAERMVGWCSAEVLGQTLGELLERAGTVDSQAEAAASQMLDWQGTITCRHRNGTPQVVATSITVVRDEDGVATGRVCIGTDITEFSRLREKYERSQRLQTIGMLAAGIAHDLRNTLTPVTLGVQLLRERVQDTEDLQLLDTMQAATARAAAVVRQILGFTRGMGDQPQLIQAQHILREVAGIVHDTFCRSIVVEESIPADLWPVMANPTQLHQVLLNLCVNARDAMPDGGVLRMGGRNCHMDERTAAAIEGARPGAWVVLTVQDTGEGIAPESLPHIWEPFFTTKSLGQGTGLGLSTVRDIVAAHAGFVSVTSTPGSGSTFEVYLPAAGLGAMSEPAPEPVGVLVGHGELVLVVDDERAVREAVMTLLTKAGYSVVAAVHGAAAVGEMRASPDRFNLVLTDIDMPELDGYGLAEAVRSIRPSLPIVAMSALPVEDTAPARCFAAWLAKPFSGAVLLDTVRRALGHVQPNHSDEA